MVIFSFGSFGRLSYHGFGSFDRLSCREIDWFICRGFDRLSCQEIDWFICRGFDWFICRGFDWFICRGFDRLSYHSFGSFDRLSLGDVDTDGRVSDCREKPGAFLRQLETKSTTPVLRRGHAQSQWIMQISKRLLLFLACVVLLPGCKKDIEQDQFEVNQVSLYPSAGAKNKLKTQEQYVSILYTNLFQQALSGNQLVQIIDCLESIGDKELGREVLISNFMNRPEVILPSDSIMHAQPEQFILDTYERFYVRLPSEAEKTWLLNFIAGHPQIRPELIYISFALSNEYLYY